MKTFTPVSKFAKRLPDVISLAVSEVRVVVASVVVP
jgi:hypothetical protein